MHRALAICVLLATATAPALTLPATACEPAASSSAPLPTPTAPPGYTYYPATGSYYKHHNEKFVTWIEANATCASEGAYLMVLNDAKEADVVRGILKDPNLDYHHITWTGALDKRPGGVSDWRTIHEEPLSEAFHEWYDGRPDNIESTSCAFYLAQRKRLYDALCNSKWYFTCEISQ